MKLAEQVGLALVPDLENQQIRLVALKPPGSGAAVIDDESWIKLASMDVKDVPKKRLSQVWTSFGQINPTGSLKSAANYRSTLISRDVAAEGDDEYTKAAVKKNLQSLDTAIWQSGGGEFKRSLTLALFAICIGNSDSMCRYSAAPISAWATPRRCKRAMPKTPPAAPDTIPIRILSLKKREEWITVEAEEQRYVNEVAATDRTVVVDGAVKDFNLRTEHDKLYQAPTGTETVTLRIDPAGVIGSTTTAPALDIGSWPAGTTVVIEKQWSDQWPWWRRRRYDQRRRPGWRRCDVHTICRGIGQQRHDSVGRRWRWHVHVHVL